MTFRATGFIINKKDLRDTDRFFTFYTREYGKIQAMGQATKKLESKLSGKLELLHCVTVTIAKGKQLDRIATVDLHEPFEGIKQNLERLTVVLYCFEIFNQLVKWEHRDDELYALLENFMSTMAETSREQRIPLSDIFISKLAAILGYEPQDGGKTCDIARSFLQSHLTESLKSRDYFDHLAGNR